MTNHATGPAAQVEGRRGLHAIIVGGSIGGLTAALLLLRSGHSVEVFERSSGVLGGRGAGIVTHPELFHVLARAGIEIEPAALGVTVAGRRVLDRTGGIVAEQPLAQCLASWSRLHGLLRDAVPSDVVRSGANVVRLEAGRESVSVRLGDGRQASGDLLVGADGLFSTVRAALLPAVRPAYAGYVAWRGLAEEADLTEATRARICDHFAFCLPPGEQILGYPVLGGDDDTARGRRRFNFVWYRPANDQALGGLLTDADGVRHELSIPPHRIRPENLAAMRADAERLLAPAFAEVVIRSRQPFLQSILDLETTSMTPSPRVALVGDAAFVARPHVGMGVTKAVGDAAMLVEALDGEGGDVDAALAAYEARRRPYGHAIVARSRALGAYMQAQHLDAAEREAAERHRRPEAVMAETAVAPRFDVD